LFSIRWLKKFWIWVLLIIILLFLVSSHQKRNGGWNPLEQVAVEISSPFQRLFSNTIAAARNIWFKYFELINTHKQNLLLKDEIYSLKVENYQYKERVAAYQRFQKLLQLKNTTGKPAIAAQVVGWDSSGLFKSVIIDKGRSSGLKTNMPVINADGVVGRLVAVSADYSKALLLIDQNSAVDCLISRTRDGGIVKGLSAKSIIFESSMDYVHKNSDIILGDTVVTSGSGGVFQKGIPVGTVIEVSEPSDEFFMNIKIMPSVDFSKLEEVLVILTEDPLAE
jgi:rod shape-determining protein MreC